MSFLTYVPPLIHDGPREVAMLRYEHDAWAHSLSVLSVLST